MRTRVLLRVARTFCVLALGFTAFASVSDESQCTAAAQSPDGSGAGCQPAERGKKKIPAKYDVTRIGQRGVGRGLNFYSLRRESALGERIAQRIDEHSKFINDPAATAYVERLAQKIVRNSDAEVPFTIKLIDSPEATVLGLPGGYLYVTRGLIEATDNEAELAVLMAHEIAHVAARHATRGGTRNQISNAIATPFFFVGGTAATIITSTIGIGFPLSSVKFNRDSETEADLLGIEYAYAAGYDPAALIDFFERARAQEKTLSGPFLKRHLRSLFFGGFFRYPKLEKRIERTQMAISTYLEPRDEYIVDTGDFQEVKARISHIRKKAPTGQEKVPKLRRGDWGL